MSGYADGEALVLAQVQAVAGFGPANTSRGKWGLLNTGAAPVYAILHKGEWAMTWLGPTLSEFTWQTVVQVWQSYTADGVALTNLEANEELLIARFLAYRKLGDTAGIINDSNPRRGGAPTEMWEAGGNGPRWLRLDIIVEWKEHRSVTFAE
jgi:hypothetical protein